MKHVKRMYFNNLIACVLNKLFAHIVTIDGLDR